MGKKAGLKSCVDLVPKTDGGVVQELDSKIFESGFVSAQLHGNYGLFYRALTSCRPIRQFIYIYAWWLNGMTVM